jgi:hypothetical protein
MPPKPFLDRREHLHALLYHQNETHRIRSPDFWRKEYQRIEEISPGDRFDRHAAVVPLRAILRICEESVDGQHVI